jgi:hypothetical protein
MSVCQHHLSSFSAQHLANVAWALAKLGAQPRPFFMSNLASGGPCCRGAAPLAAPRTRERRRSPAAQPVAPPIPPTPPPLTAHTPRAQEGRCPALPSPACSPRPSTHPPLSQRAAPQMLLCHRWQQPPVRPSAAAAKAAAPSSRRPSAPAASLRRLDAFAPPEMANLLWAASRLAAPVEPDWLEACLEGVGRRLGEYSADECAIIMRAVAAPSMREHVGAGAPAYGCSGLAGGWPGLGAGRGWALPGAGSCVCARRLARTARPPKRTPYPPPPAPPRLPCR